MKKENTKKLYTGYNFENAEYKEPENLEKERENIRKVLRGGTSPTPCPYNFEAILKTDPVLRGGFAYNSFNGKIELTKPMPWRTPSTVYEVNMTDYDLKCINSMLDAEYGFSSVTLLYDAIVVVSHDNAYHPILNKIAATSWDGIERVETLLVTYLGADDNSYTRAVTKKWLLAALTRLYNPGAKFDSCLVMTGAQGVGKSTLLRKLSFGYFVDKVEDVDSVAAAELVVRSWIVEFAELSGLRKSDFNSVKNFLSTQDDTFRAPYAKFPETHPRRCVFSATCNDATILRDPTGNRRFWVIPIDKTKMKKSPFDVTESEVLQIWAEVNEIYKTHSESLILNAEDAKTAEALQEAYREEDPWESEISNFLSHKVPENWDAMTMGEHVNYFTKDENVLEKLDAEPGKIYRERICCKEIWEECIQLNREMKVADTRRIGQILNGLGWKHGTRVKCGPYGQQRAYIKHYTEKRETVKENEKTPEKPKKEPKQATPAKAEKPAKTEKPYTVTERKDKGTTLMAKGGENNSWNVICETHTYDLEF